MITTRRTLELNNRVLASIHNRGNEESITGPVELDSHADTCCAGSNCVVIEHTGKVCNVVGFNRNTPNDELKGIPVVKAATAYDAPTGETFIIILAQALYLGEYLDYSLLCPNQLRHNGLIVDDVPRHLSPNPSNASHSIFVPEENVTIPLEMRGVISLFYTRRPTQEEIENKKWLIFTSSLDWDPHSEDFMHNELAVSLTDLSADRNLLPIISHNNIPQEPDINPQLSSISSVYSDTLLYQGIKANTHYTYQQAREIGARHSSSRHAGITKEALASLWGISLHTAAQTLRVTTQKGIKNSIHPVVRRFATKQSRLRYNQLGSRHGRFYSDTFFASIPSTRGNTMAQLFVNDVKYLRIMPMKKKSDAGSALLELLQDIGIPSALHTDGAKELNQGKWKSVCEEFGIKQTLTEPYSPWQNRAEINIREAKKSVQRLMSRTNTPKALWDYCACYIADLTCYTANDIYVLHGRTPHEVVTGNTPDITEYTEFSWYEHVFVYDDLPFPDTKRNIARWLGVAHRVGQALCYWLLNSSGQVVARTTVQKIMDEELLSPTVQSNIKDFDTQIQRLFDGGEIKDENPDTYLIDENYNDCDEPFEPQAAMPEQDSFVDADTYDKFISAQVLLPRGDGFEKGTVTRRKRDSDGNLIGHANSNPILDTRVYEVVFPDGNISEYATNVITENIFAMVDDEGYENALFKAIIDHRCDRNLAVSAQEAWITSHNGNKHPRLTTKGWDLCVEWSDGTTSWIPLKDLKVSNPVEVSDYAVAHNLTQEPAFSWWVNEVLQKRDRMIAAVNTRYIKRTHKFGIELPKTVEHALEIDRITGTTYWHDAIQKEMRNNAIAFEFLQPGDSIPIGFTKITLHMVFDIKIDFTRKARLVAGGHLTDVPSNLTYSSVVSRESVRIMFLIAALNDLQILSADIGNAYLNAPNREKVYAIAGKEFGSKAGQLVIIVRALYGLKSAGAAWRSHLASSLIALGYQSCLADPDIWMRPAVKNDNSEYYEYLAIYVDDTLCISSDPLQTMTSISKMYRLKDNSIATPTTYLGAQVVQYKLPDDGSKIRWGMSSQQYISNAIKTVECELSKIGKSLSNNVSTPIASGYRPELDVSPYLNPQQANYFQNLIGILRWAIELGRLDIHVHVSMLSSFLACPRVGHLEQTLHIFAYLKKYDRSTMVFDDTLPVIDESKFQTYDWTEFYRDAKEDIPLNCPMARGKEVHMYCFCDADHAGDRVTRRSQTGIIIFLNRAPITWYSKKQNTVESSTFGSEFVALRIATELIISLRYKLRMMGIPIRTPCITFCDNETAIRNSTIPESMLKKKHNSIAYHRVREAVAADILRIGYIPSSDNLADMFTKPLPRAKIHEFCEQILY